MGIFQRGEPVFFCHIPKTGGTAFRRALEAKFNPWNVLPDDYMMKRAGGQYPDIAVWFPSAIRYPVGLARGHYHLATGKLLGEHVKLVTVLREPVSRTISHINHSLRHLGMKPDVARSMLDSGHVPLLDNVQARYFSGLDKAETPEQILELNRTFLNGSPADPVREGLAEDAISAADQCAHIGTTEALGDLASIMGITLPEERVNEGKSLFDFSERDIDLIRERNLADIALYDHVRRMDIHGRSTATENA